MRPTPYLDILRNHTHPGNMPSVDAIRAALEADRTERPNDPVWRIPMDELVKVMVADSYVRAQRRTPGNILKEISAKRMDWLVRDGLTAVIKTPHGTLRKRRLLIWQLRYGFWSTIYKTVLRLRVAQYHVWSVFRETKGA